MFNFRLHYLLFCVYCVLPAQDVPTPAIKVTTHLVQVNVIAHRHGEPVRDLKKEDFTLTEKGKARKIAFFSMDAIDGPAKPEAAMAANIFSNRVHRGDTPTSITLILFDALNTRIQDQQYAKMQMVKFLQQIQPQDRVAIYLMGRTIHVLHDFTNDPDRLKQILAKFHGRIPNELPDEADLPSEIAEAFQDSERAYSDFSIMDRASVTFDSMEAIAHHLAALPGRKNLVWISSSFPFTLGLEPEDFGSTGEHRTFGDEATRVGRAMNDANVAIYPVDARGLIGMPASFNASSRSSPVMPATPRGVGMPRIQQGPKTVSTSPQNHDTMLALADRTGGHAFFNTNDIAGAIRNAIDDALVTYTLGFYPDSDDLDGKFHELKVKVDRPGIDVRYRKGFVAFTEHTPTAKDLMADLKKAISSPLEATGIGINIRMDPSDKPKPGSRALVIQINQDDFTIEPAGLDQWRCRLELAMVQTGHDGKPLSFGHRTLDLKITKEAFDNIRKAGLLLNQIIEPVPNAENFRILALDHATGNLGSVQIPLK